jgi:hypothetical protein
VPPITEWCRQGACERCTNPACAHSCHTVAVLLIPRCGLCDKDATVETIAWGCRADLCAEHADQYADHRQPRRTLRAGPAALPLLSEDEAGLYVESQTYRRARPVYRGRPQAPHEYLLARRSPDPWTQLRLLAFIREHGERRRFSGSYHPYWTWGDYEYWELSPQDTILNRRHLSWPTTA